MEIGQLTNPYTGYAGGFGYASYSQPSVTPAATGYTDANPDSAKAKSAADARKTATGAEETEGTKIIRNPGQSEVKQAGRKSSPAECETCKNRKYQDGSDEDNVSFKAAGHIDPSATAARVRGHEQEHVNNAYKKAAQGNGKVVACNVTLKSAICPECGRSYVAGGTTATQIKYYNEKNPYQQQLKASDAANKYRGMNIDVAC